MKKDFDFFLERTQEGLDDEGKGHLADRGLDAFYAPYLDVTNDGATIVFPYTRNSIVERFKCRSALDKKSMWMVANENAVDAGEEHNPKSKYKLPFFNQKNFVDRSYVIVTEGEYDAYAAVQLGFINAISLPSGASSARSAFLNNFDYINQFDLIYVCFDMDEFGEKAAVEVSKVIDHCKYRRINLPFKDLNDLVRAKPDFSYGDFEQLMRDASKHTTGTVVPMSKCTDDLIYQTVGEGKMTGFQEFDKLLRGLRPGELTTVTGDTACGKTTFCVNIIFNLVSKGTPCYITSHEMRWQSVMRKLGSMYLGKSLRDDETDMFDRERFKKWRSQAPLFFNPLGEEMTMDSLLLDLEFAAKVHGVEVFLVEDLNFLSRSDGSTSEREAYDRNILALRNKMKTLGGHMLLIVHAKQTSDDKTMISMASMKGSSGIKQGSDNNFVVLRLDRLTESEEMRGRVMISLKKNREYGSEGDIYLRYNPRTDSYSDEVVKIQWDKNAQTKPSFR